MSNNIEPTDTKLSKKVKRSYDTKRSFLENIRRISAIDQSPASRYDEGEKLVQKAIDKKDITPEELKHFEEIILSLNAIETNRVLMETMDGNINKTAIAEFCDDLIEEFNCQSISEKSLCSMIASAYFNSMIASKCLRWLYNLTNVSNEKNGYYNIVGKELEKQQRIYLHSLQVLKNLKTPSLWVSIQARNAFIGDKQTFNNYSPIIWDKD